jgi:phage gpG-like protein
MTGARITFALDASGPLKLLADFKGVLKTGVPKAIGMALVLETQHRFFAATDPMGSPWKALIPAYAAIQKGKGILRVKLNLMDSITSAVSGNTVVVGTNWPSAAVHQFGAVIKPVHGKALAFKLGGVGKKGGPGIVHLKSVTIPARPYLGFGPKDERAVLEVVARSVQRIFGS